MDVSFSSPINCAVTPPGGATTASTQCGILSASANVTASISADTSAGALTVLSVTSFILETKIETPDPGDLPPGVKPVPVKVQVPVQVAQSNGVTPLAVASGQYVVVTIQFAPTASSPAASTAALLIHGDTWNPVSIPITATVGQISVKIPAIVVEQGKSVAVGLTVTLVSGAPTTAVLLIDREGSADAPNVAVTVSPSSLPLLTQGISVPATLTVTADSTLAAGKYSWTLAVWSYDNTASFSVPVTITVAVVVPYFFIKSKLDGNVIDIAAASTKPGAGLDAYPRKTSSNDNQLWHFLPDPAGSGYFYIVSKLNGNVIDVQKASKAPGAPLDAYPKKDGADNQLWYFVSDPEGSGFCFIVNKLNGHVIDVQAASKAAGAPLDAYPVKFSGYDNQLWKVVDGSFPSVVQTAQTPKGGLVQGNVNYFFGANSQALYGLSVTVKFTSDFVSSANGYSFQLNCFSTIGPTVTTEVQQFVIYASPGSNQLVARIDTFAASDVELNRIDSNLADLPSSTIPAGYSFNITLNYYNGDSAVISGATYTLFDHAGNPVGTTTITIIGNSLLSTNHPATLANLAPIAAFQFVIGGDYGGALAALTSGAGTVTYNASVGLIAQATQPSFTPGDGQTTENANMLWGWLPWPWSISMQNDSQSVVQTFTVPAGGSAVVAKPAGERLKGHVLPPPGDRSFSRRAMPASGR